MRPEDTLTKGKEGNLTLIIVNIFDIEKTIMGDNKEEFIMTLGNTSNLIDLNNNTFKNPFKAYLKPLLVDTSGAGNAAEAGGYGIAVGFGVSVVT